MFVKLLQNRSVRRQLCGDAIDEQHHEAAVTFRAAHWSGKSWTKLNSIADTKAGIHGSPLCQVLDRTVLREIGLPITPAIGTVSFVANTWGKLAGLARDKREPDKLRTFAACADGISIRRLRLWRANAVAWRMERAFDQIQIGEIGQLR